MSAAASARLALAAPLARRLPAPRARSAARALGRPLVGTPARSRTIAVSSASSDADASPSPASGSTSGSTSGNKVCVITGANTGLGFISAREISLRPGWTVVMAVRDLRKGADAASRIEASGAARPDVLELDLADLRSVDAFATAFAAKHGRCDVLMNNAGVMALPERALSLDGIEMQMATNHMGHFYLTCAMMPSILAAPGRPRVVNLSSVAHEWGHVDFENVNSEGFFGYPASGWLTYGRTKLANLYFTYELHRRLRLAPGASERGTDRVDVNAVHPGIVDTDLPRSLSLNFYPALKRSGGLITPEQGARGQIAAAIDDAFEGVSGKYIAEQSGPRRSGGAGVKGAFEVSESSKYSYDAEAAARFWKVSKAMTGAAWEVLGEKKEPKIIY